MTKYFTAKPIPFPLRCYLDDESNESNDDGDDDDAMEDKDELKVMMSMKMVIAGNEVESERGR